MPLHDEDRTDDFTDDLADDPADPEGVRDEIAERLHGTLAGILERLPALARVRLLAFLHLVEHPDSTKAFLDVEPSGGLRLVLETCVAPCRSQQH